MTITFDVQGGWTTMPSVTFTGTTLPDVAIPRKDYNTFGGYYDQPGGAGNLYFNANGQSVTAWDKGADATLYAAWTDVTPSGVTRRTVTLDKNGGTGGSDGPIYGYSGYNLPYVQVPSKSRYIFQGYYYGSTQYIDATGAPARTFDRSSNTTLTAKWEPLPVWYTVTFDVNGGFEIPAAEKTYEYQFGKTYGSQKPLPPSYFIIPLAVGEFYYAYRWGGRGGATWRFGSTILLGNDFGDQSSNHPSPWIPLAQKCFLGWYTAPVGGTRITDSTVCDLSRDTTLYAHWDFSTVTLKFDAQGGEFSGGQSVTTASFDLSYGKSYGRLPRPVRTGYRFQGWYTLPKGLTIDEHCVALGYDPSGVHDPDYRPWYPADFVAEWEAYPRGGRKVLATDHYDPVPYTGFQPLLGDPGRFFRVIDWNIGDSRNVAIRRLCWHWFDVSIAQGDPMALPTLYAHWTDGTPDVTLNDCGGSGGDGVVTVGAGGVLPSVTPPVRSGATFLGYYRYPNGGGVKYYNANGTAAATWADSCDGEIFAAWYVPPTPKPTLTVALYAAYRNASSGFSRVESLGRTISVHYGEPYGALPTEPATAGYRLDFWEASETDWPTGSSSAAVGPSTVVAINADHYLIAVMARADYAIRYDTMGVALPNGAPTSYTFGVGASLPTVAAMGQVAPSGLVFGGWYENADFSGSAISQISTSRSGDVTVHAKWSPVTVTVTLDANGGTIAPASVTRSNGDVYGDLPRPVRSGYTFAGWQTSGGDEITAFSVVAAPSGAITLTAQWTAAQTSVPWGYAKFSIDLILDGGTLAASYGALKYVAGYAKALPTAAQVSKSGATFGGWYADASFSGSPVTSIPSTSTGRVTYYARWL